MKKHGLSPSATAPPLTAFVLGPADEKRVRLMLIEKIASSSLTTSGSFQQLARRLVSLIVVSYAEIGSIAAESYDGCSYDAEEFLAVSLPRMAAAILAIELRKLRPLLGPAEALTSRYLSALKESTPASEAPAPHVDEFIRETRVALQQAGLRLLPEFRTKIAPEDPGATSERAERKAMAWKCRKERNLTDGQIAEQAGVNPRSFRAWLQCDELRCKTGGTADLAIRKVLAGESSPYRVEKSP